MPLNNKSGEGRFLVQFSCGAASAVAVKLVLAKYGHDRVHIINAFMADEHEDNRRFLSDCRNWFEHDIQVVGDQKYGASALEVWEKTRYIKGPHGATCTKRLKRDILGPHMRQTDIHVLGYTAEEDDRFISWQQENPGFTGIAPLIKNNLGKSDCLGIIDRAGLILPITYRLGFDNANCLNCCKGGMDYWNKIRKHFPERFNRAAEIEKSIGPNARMLVFRSGPRAGDRMWLTELTEEMGLAYADEPSISCSFFCQMAEQDIQHGLVQVRLRQPGSED